VWDLSLSLRCFGRLRSSWISIIEPTRFTICFQFITINSLYMFPSFIYSSSGGTVYTTNGIFCTYYVGWLLAGLEWNWKQIVHLVGPIILIYYEARSKKIFFFLNITPCQQVKVPDVSGDNSTFLWRIR
jgi:hypothetical protein